MRLARRRWCLHPAYWSSWVRMRLSTSAVTRLSKPRAAGQDIPDGQHDAQVDVLVFARVVQPVVGRAHDHPAHRAEGPAQVGVLERADAHVDRDQHRSDRAGRHQDHDRDRGQDEPRGVHERMSPWPRANTGRRSAGQIRSQIPVATTSVMSSGAASSARPDDSTVSR
jgi:hypothetical protein